MRFYAKLLLLIVAFACLMSPAARRGASDLAYAVRVQAVMTFGAQADYEALVDDTQRALAARNGRLDVYLAGKRYRELLAAAVADAARRDVRLTESEFERLRARCAAEAFGSVCTEEANLEIRERIDVGGRIKMAGG